MEAIGDGAKQGTVDSRSRRPFCSEVGVGDGACETPVPGRENTPLPYFARAFRNRVFDRLAGVEPQMLEVGANAGRDVLEAFAPYATASGTQAGEVILYAYPITLKGPSRRKEKT
jgi:hypothetical protein